MYTETHEVDWLPSQKKPKNPTYADMKPCRFFKGGKHNILYLKVSDGYIAFDSGNHHVDDSEHDMTATTPVTPLIAEVYTIEDKHETNC